MSRTQLLQACASRDPAGTGAIKRRSFDELLQNFFGGESTVMQEYIDTITEQATQMVDYTTFVNMIFEDIDAASPPALQRSGRRDRGWRPVVKGVRLWKETADIHCALPPGAASAQQSVAPAAAAAAARAPAAGVKLWRYSPSDKKPTFTRDAPEIGGAPTAVRMRPGTHFRVSEERQGEGGVLFLKLQGNKGWLFDRLPGGGVVCVRSKEVRPMEQCRPAPADFRTFPPEAWAAIYGRFTKAATAEVCKVLRPLKLEEELAKEFLKGRSLDDPLPKFFDMQGEDIKQMVQRAAAGLENRINDAIKTAREATRLQGARGEKFTGELKGGSLAEFHSGVTGLVGEPHDDLEEGMREEHTERRDSASPFTTSNYGITTTPQLEYELVIRTDLPPLGGQVPASSMRRCSKPGGEVQMDLRFLRPIQSFLDTYSVKQAELVRIEVVALVLFTGPMFALYNGILREFGFCGEVLSGIEFWSEDGEFKRQHEAMKVEVRMRRADHKFASTVHCLVSGVKKLQGASSGVQGTWLYRGLGGRDPGQFLSGNGFTDKGFMSTTTELDIALEYSGTKDGFKGGVLAMQMSEVDQGAELAYFSQYPAEKEIVWNACSYTEALKGEEQLIITPKGPVKMIVVKTNANGKAMTVEELQKRRKIVVVKMLRTLNQDIVRQVDNAAKEDVFRKKVYSEHCCHIKTFIQKVKDAGQREVDWYEEQVPKWYHSDAQFAKAVASAAALPTLVRSWIDVFLESTSLDRRIDFVKNWNFLEACMDLHVKRYGQLRRARLEEDTATVQTLALRICSMKGLLRQDDGAHPDMPAVEGGSRTPLIEKCYESDAHAVALLMEARAAVHIKDEVLGTTPLHAASTGGDTDIIGRLLKARANIEATDARGRTPMHTASTSEAVRLCMEAKADIEVADNKGRTPLYSASDDGIVGAVLALLAARASVKAANKSGVTPLHVACHVDVVRALLEARAEVEAAENQGLVPLHAAAMNGHISVVQALLETRASVEATRSGSTMLHSAAAGGNVEIVKMFIEKGFDIEAAENQGLGPLHTAAMEGHISVVRELLEARASVEAANKGQLPRKFWEDADAVGVLLKATDRFEVELKVLLATRKLQHLIQPALMWCQQSGVESIITLVEDSKIEAFLSTLVLKPYKKKLLKQDFLRRCKADAKKKVLNHRWCSLTLQLLQLTMQPLRCVSAGAATR